MGGDYERGGSRKSNISVYRDTKRQRRTLGLVENDRLCKRVTRRDSRTTRASPGTRPRDAAQRPARPRAASHGHGLAFAAMVDDDAAAFAETVRARPSPRLGTAFASQRPRAPSEANRASRPTSLAATSDPPARVPTLPRTLPLPQARLTFHDEAHVVTVTGSRNDALCVEVRPARASDR
jgi:hypothetical protein